MINTRPRALALLTCAALAVGLLCTAALAAQTAAAEGYATALGVPVASLKLVDEDAPFGEEEWTFTGGQFWINSDTGAFSMMGADGSAAFNQNSTPIASDEAAIALARQFIADYGQGLGIPSPGEDTTAVVEHEPGLDAYPVTIAHWEGGLSAFPRWGLGFDAGGNLVALGYTPCNGTLPSATPDVTAEQAASAVAAGAGEQLTVESSSLWYDLADDGAPQLIWRLRLTGGDLIYLAHVDAHSGAVIWAVHSLSGRPSRIAADDPQPGHPLSGVLAIAVLVTKALWALAARVLQH